MSCFHSTYALQRICTALTEALRPGINPDDEEYTEEEEEGYLTDDSVDPDEMTYEARHSRRLHAPGHMD